MGGVFLTILAIILICRYRKNKKPITFHPSQVYVEKEDEINESDGDDGIINISTSTKSRISSSTKSRTDEIPESTLHRSESGFGSDSGSFYGISPLFTVSLDDQSPEVIRKKKINQSINDVVVFYHDQGSPENRPRSIRQLPLTPPPPLTNNYIS